MLILIYYFDYNATNVESLICDTIAFNALYV